MLLPCVDGKRSQYLGTSQIGHIVSSVRLPGLTFHEGDRETLQECDWTVSEVCKLAIFRARTTAGAETARDAESLTAITHGCSWRLFPQFQVCRPGSTGGGHFPTSASPEQKFS